MDQKCGFCGQICANSLIKNKNYLGVSMCFKGTMIFCNFLTLLERLKNSMIELMFSFNILIISI